MNSFANTVFNYNIINFKYDNKSTYYICWIGVLFLFANLNAQSTNDKIIRNFIKNDVTFRANSNVEFKIQNEDK